MTPPNAKRDLLSIEDLADDLPALLLRAQRLKAERRRGMRRPILRGRNLGMIFEKSSTRTRTSFEVAMNDLGGHALYFSARDLQLGRGETIPDTARVLSRYLDGLVYRAYRHEDVTNLARSATVPVVNALDDLEHPCQIVADLETMHERWRGRFRGRRVAWVGDGNNVLHSLLLGCGAVGLDVSAATPSGYEPRPDVVERARALAQRSGSSIALTHEPVEAVRGADAVYTDVWVSMGDEAEKEERERAFRGYCVDDALVDRAAPGAFVLHDLPAHRGQEITDAVLDGPRSAAWDQAEYPQHAPKAILELLLAPRRTAARRPGARRAGSRRRQ